MSGMAIARMHSTMAAKENLERYVLQTLTTRPTATPRECRGEISRPQNFAAAYALVGSVTRGAGSGVVVLALVIMPAGLGAVAAGRHRAPAALARPAVVEEQPAAFGVGAAPHPIEPRPGEQV